MRSNASGSSKPPPASFTDMVDAATAISTGGSSSSQASEFGPCFATCFSIVATNFADYVPPEPVVLVVAVLVLD